MKRLLLIFLLTSLGLSSKAQSVDFFVTDVNYSQEGSTVKVPVVVSSTNTAISLFEFTIKWDTTAIVFVDNLTQDESIVSWSRFLSQTDSSITYKASNDTVLVTNWAYLTEFGFEAKQENWISTWIDITDVKALDTDSLELRTNAYPGVIYNRVSTSIETDRPFDEIFEVHPNPVSTYLTIGTNSIDYTIRIFDIQGKKVLEERNESTIEVASMPSGLYIIEVQDRNRIGRYLRTKL